ncbi:MAG: dephospho-CoA kinase [Eubacterium sp.]|nr:dephospho-CoA kinase [Eubacterium sp.]
MNITITGNLGSGKTSVCKELKKMGFAIVSAGDIFRELAAEKGMTVIELNEAAKSDRSIDDMLDQRSSELGRKMDQTVFDSRLAWHFAAHSFKVFLLVDTQEAARRVFAGDSRNAENYADVKEAEIGLKTRARLEQERFANLYGLDYYDASNYDLVIESSMASPQQLAQEIIRNFEQYQKEPFSTKAELNLQGFYPQKRFAQMDLKRLEHCRRQEEQTPGLCAIGKPDLAVKNGYYCIEKGHHAVFAAIAAGKVFAQAGSIRIDDADGNKEWAVTAQDLAAFEQAGNFQYYTNPALQREKPGCGIKF